MTTEKIEIKAYPRKGFFIDMLTRDINLADCILDLIDNSIDSILEKTKFDPMKGLLHQENKKLGKYSITINFTEKEFLIEDNSDGVKEKDAIEKVFRFGSDINPKKKLGLSVYGIGMKRAFFKIGKLIEFNSISKDGEVSVKLDVDKWMNNGVDWDLNGEFKKNKNKKQLGTKIVIKKINNETIPSFSSMAFETKLIEKLQTTYGIFIDCGLTIKVNETKVAARIPTISISKDMGVSSKLFDKDGVQIKIIAGVSKDDKKLNGWFVFCNGRMILEGDKTSNTGWGGGLLRKFHASTNRFVGFVYFKSDNVGLLPWTTTKNGVNFESTIYQYALEQMVKIAQPIVNLLTRQYSADKNVMIDELLKDAKDTSLSDIKKTNIFFNTDIKVTAKKKDEQIHYSVPLKDIEQIKKIMQNEKISNSEIGKDTFYYYLEHEE